MNKNLSFSLFPQPSSANTCAQRAPYGTVGSRTPINNHYSPIDLPTLKSNNFKAGTMKRKGVELPLIIELSKYSNELLNTSLLSSPTKGKSIKESIILNSKEIVNNNVFARKINDASTNENKSSSPTTLRNNKLVDMLNIRPKKVDLANILNQRYLKTFNDLDIELAQNKNTLYEFGPKKTLNFKILSKNVYKILESSFFGMSSVISIPHFYVSPNNVIVNLFYYTVPKANSDSTNKKDLNILNLEGLLNKLSKYFKKPITLELTKLYSVSNNSQILAHVLGKLGLSRKRSFARIIGRFLSRQSEKIFFRKSINKFSGAITGVYIKLGGRLLRGKIVPRRTVKKIQYGSLARSKSNYITSARITQKNKRGSFSFTVAIGHNFF